MMYVKLLLKHDEQEDIADIINAYVLFCEKYKMHPTKMFINPKCYLYTLLLCQCRFNEATILATNEIPVNQIKFE